MSEPPTFLISRTDAIGDVVLTLPVAGRLRQLYPGCRVVLIGRAYTAAVAAACPWVDEFLDFNELEAMSEQAVVTPAEARAIEDEQVAVLRRYEAAAILHVFPNRLLARLARRAGIPLRIGTRNRWWHWLTCNRLVALSRRHSPLHETQLNMALLGPLEQAAPSPPRPPSPKKRGEPDNSLTTGSPLVLGDSANQADAGRGREVAALTAAPYLVPAVLLPPQVAALLAARQPGQLNVVLHPRSRGSAREWGVDNFGALARVLHAAGHRVLVSGTAAEGAELAGWLRENAPYLAADLTGQLALPEFIALLAAADGIVAGSTGPLHLAAALGRHALGLYPPIRPMHPGRWAPLGPLAEYLVFDKPDCEDCRARPLACTCIRAIGVAGVAARVAAWPAVGATR